MKLKKALEIVPVMLLLSLEQAAKHRL